MGDRFCGEITYNGKSGQSFYDVPCGGAKGRTVKLTRNGGPLTVCEVRAFGKSLEAPNTGNEIIKIS